MSFNGISYASGVLTGLILKWTDILPIVGGFCLGLTVRSVPDLFEIHDVQGFMKKCFQQLMNKTQVNQ